MALEWAEELGCRTMQIFSHNPRGWSVRPLRPDEAEEFIRRGTSLDIQTFIHASYLINPVSASLEVREKSIQLLKIELDRADVLGVDHVILHPGVHGGISSEGAVNLFGDGFRILRRLGSWRAKILLENTSGSKGDMASAMESLGRLVEEAGALCGGICLDTCHAHAAGYDLATTSGLKRWIGELERHVGLEQVRVMHLNDSRGPAGSGLDRHEHIGQGTIGAEGLRRLLAHPAFAAIPVILETPQKTDEDDRINLRRVRELLG
jgi:deoxyribonuclease-4